MLFALCVKFNTLYLFTLQMSTRICIFVLLLIYHLDFVPEIFYLGLFVSPRLTFVF